jgi:hypothetical protein
VDSLIPEAAMVAASMLLITLRENKPFFKPVGERVARHANRNAELLTRHLKGVVVIGKLHTQASGGQFPTKKVLFFYFQTRYSSFATSAG